MRAFTDQDPTVAKTPADRNELLRTVVSGNPKFFLGTDSAPHPAIAKRGGADGKDKAAAGVFTQPYATQTVLDALEEGIEQKVISENDVTKEKLEGLLSRFGRAFYRVPDETGEKIVLRRQADTIVGELSAGLLEVVPFRRGQKTWKVEWI
jgi:dihydroorotase